MYDARLSCLQTHLSNSYSSFLQRYTKVLDNIKTLRKEQAKDLKVDQTKLDHLRSDMQKSEKVRETMGISLGV